MSVVSILISPDNLNSAYAEQLVRFFETQSQEGVRLWEPDEIYCFSDGQRFRFSHLILQRHCVKNPGNVRYEFINDIARGAGTFGVVLDIANTLVIKPHDAFFEQKPRVVKIEWQSDMVSTHYRLMKLAGHLKIYEPVQSEKSMFTVMERAPGHNLHEILIDHENKWDVLTPWKCLALFEALPAAVARQVTERGIVHRDLKLENIMAEALQFDLHLAKVDPATDTLESLFEQMRLKNNYAIFLFENSLFHLCRKDKSCRRIERTPGNQSDFDWLCKQIASLAAFDMLPFKGQKCELTQLRTFRLLDISPYQIHVIDYALGSKLDEIVESVKGSIGYIAPEMYSPDRMSFCLNASDPLLDVFSLGIILAILFEANMLPPANKNKDNELEADKAEQTAYEYAWNASRLRGLFSDTIGLSLHADVKDKIRFALECMLQPHPARRWGLASVTGLIQDMALFKTCLNRTIAELSAMESASLPLSSSGDRSYPGFFSGRSTQQPTGNATRLADADDRYTTLFWNTAPTNPTPNNGRTKLTDAQGGYHML